MTKEKPSFTQQNLPAWQPIFTAGTVLPYFFLIGVAFIPIGIGLLMASNTVQEVIVDYTDCPSENNPTPCHAELVNDIKKRCTCKMNLEIKQDYRRTVYAYYSLTNFYQNHRRYVRSRDDYQLLGHPTSVSKDCAPFQRDVNNLPIAPCGAIANSKFNDTFSLKLEESGVVIPMARNNIAWESDKNIRFRNPPLVGNSLAMAFNGTAKPPNWETPVYALGLPNNNGFQNEDLIVWMRTAALPTFRKLYGYFDQQSDEGIYLPKGNYSITIRYNFPVKMFGGKKRFILSDTSSLGGKNNFLGIAYIIVGSICFLLSAAFLFIHKKYGHLSSEMIQINQQTPYLAS